MELFGKIACCVLLALFGAISWRLPRRIGMLGMLMAQLLVAGGFFAIFCILLTTQPGAVYEGGEENLSPLFWAFVFNCLMLPIVGVAMRRHDRDKSRRATTDEKPRWYRGLRMAIVSAAFAYFTMMILKWFGFVAVHRFEFASPVLVVGSLLMMSGVLESALKMQQWRQRRSVKLAAFPAAGLQAADRSR